MNTTQANAAPTVGTYRFFVGGRYINTSTKVTFADGREVKFMDRLGKREAIRQATEELNRHPEYYPVTC